jgi:hypothetical protein
MGMFDSLYFDKEILPLSDDIIKDFPNDIEWQTKSLECVLDRLTIKDGELLVQRYETELTPENERPYPNDPRLSFIGMYRKINERFEKYDYTGSIIFYSFVNDVWYEFFGEFQDGKLIKITNK